MPIRSITGWWGCLIALGVGLLYTWVLAAWCGVER
jgi:hypothetical protein